MVRMTIEDMDLEQIASSGQCFRIQKLQTPKSAKCNLWSVSAWGTYVEIWQQGKEFVFSCEEDEFTKVWRPCFDLDTDYGAIKRSVDPGDPYLNKAIKSGWGVRILRQNLWEMIVTFLISQNNNIRRIKASVNALCGTYGVKRIGMGLSCEPDGEIVLTERTYDTFPTPEALTLGGEDGLEGLGLGYRKPYVLAIAQLCALPEGRAWMDTLRTVDYETACGMLRKERGIGKKVADCVCLFGLHHVEAFPVDTHVKQILDENYPKGFPFERYAGTAGILQQYLFYHKLSEKIEAAR